MFEKFFCKHEYKVLGELECEFKFDDDCIKKVPITFLECNKCGKRKVLKDKDWYYADSLLPKLSLWKKGQLNFEFEEGTIYYE